MCTAPLSRPPRIAVGVRGCSSPDTLVACALTLLVFLQAVGCDAHVGPHGLAITFLTPTPSPTWSGKRASLPVVAKMHAQNVHWHGITQGPNFGTEVPRRHSCFGVGRTGGIPCSAARLHASAGSISEGPVAHKCCVHTPPSASRMLAALPVLAASWRTSASAADDSSSTSAPHACSDYVDISITEGPGSDVVAKPAAHAGLLQGVLELPELAVGSAELPLCRAAPSGALALLSRVFGSS